MKTAATVLVMLVQKTARHAGNGRMETTERATPHHLNAETWLTEARKLSKRAGVTAIYMPGGGWSYRGPAFDPYAKFRDCKIYKIGGES